ncbi:hypothetical protein [Dyella mobilis]|uniref:Uncharacterized protein n=1 Tax=Dyella mobilis TaxID=1849582 RepID=A0ABS2KKZ8_9GAMM|nr:hypothetical protein [Dyella mobilis]MBM7131842.1 hypothetical protein [Dyella mobilis]GLQ96179.1 hypothetical protein GCM10007863_05970 [Dyella mobilis]
MDAHVVELTVHRAYVPWADRMRNYRVVVDGKEVAQVANGASVTVQVSEGEHVVWLKIDWCRSPQLKFRAVPGQPLAVDCGANAEPLLALLYISFLRHRYIWLSEGKAGKRMANGPLPPVQSLRTAGILVGIYLACAMLMVLLGHFNHRGNQWLLYVPAALCAVSGFIRLWGMRKRFGPGS